MDAGDFVFVAGLLFPLTVAGVMDYRYRIIPNYCCAMIFGMGLIEMLLQTPRHLFYLELAPRMAGILPAAVLLLISYHKGSSGGGDVKLVAGLGFAVGVSHLSIVLFFAVLLALAWGWLKYKRIQTFVPLAAFAAAGSWIWAIGIYFFARSLK